MKEDSASSRYVAYESGCMCWPSRVEFSDSVGGETLAFCGRFVEDGGLPSNKAKIVIASELTCVRVI